MQKAFKLFVLSLFLLPLIAAPGIEVVEKGSSGGEVESETNFVFRLEAAYQIPLGDRYAIGPTFAVDFFEDKDPTLVWGLAFGVGF
jgi:hypothetical protein